MSDIKTFPDTDQLAHAIADAAVSTLRTSINTYDNATWVLAGGTAPMTAYAIIATTLADAIDWSKVTLMLGDERMSEPDGELNNWHAIMRVLGNLPTRNFRPKSELPAEEAADDYAQYLRIVPKAISGLPRIDLLWLGVGEDGHTLSIFPNHTSLYPSDKLIIPVHDSPKPPRDRISFSLRSLQGVQRAMIIASGESKHSAVQGALSGNSTPIAIASSIIETHEGTVTWFLDKNAAPH